MNFIQKKQFRIITYILTWAFLFTMLPIGVVWADDEPKINEVNMIVNYSNDSPPEAASATLIIRGENLQNEEVLYWDKAEDKYMSARNIQYFSNGRMIQVTFGEKAKDIEFIYPINVAGFDIPVGTGVGNVTEVVDKVAELEPGTTEQFPTVTVKGSGLDDLKVVDENQTYYNYVVSTDEKEVIITIKGGDFGLKDLRLYKKRQMNIGGSRPTITFERYYANQFRLLSKWEVKNFKMMPNSGVGGETIVTFEGDNLERSSVFFVEDEKDKYELKHLGEYKYWSESDKRLQVIVPKLDTGTYRVILTNEIRDPVAGEDLRDKITRQYMVNDIFYIMTATDAPSIYSIEPDNGPNEIENEVTITARRLEELDKITGLTFGDGALNFEDAGFYTDEEGNQGNRGTFTGATVGLSGDNQTLTINYGVGKYEIADWKLEGSIFSEITVELGSNATFKSVYEQHFTNNYDELNLYFPQIDLGKYDAVQNVKLNISTFIEEDGKRYLILTQEIIKEGGFTYTPSTILPEIIEVMPSHIQVEETIGENKTKNDIVLAIKGNKFMVNRFSEAGQEITLYPRIRLGDSIIIERENNEVTITDANNYRKTFPSIKYEVFKGNVLVTGIASNDTGDKIVLHIPQGILISPSDVDKDRDIRVQNYKPRSRDLAIAGRGENLIKFYIARKWLPTISSIEPNVVSANEGRKEVEIRGSGFWDEVEVYIGGEKLDRVDRSSEELIIIDVPPARVGETTLTVQNIHPEGGGQDSKPFFYVATKDNPEITNIAPNKGTIGSQVVISGINFFPPDPSATDIADMLTLNRLIGSKVLFNGKDINQYNEVGQTIDFKNYTAPTNNPLLKIDTDGNLVLSDYYQSVYLKPDLGDGNYFKLVPIDEKRVKLTDVETTTYTLGIKEGQIVAYDRNGAGKGPVEVNNTGIALDGMTLKMKTPYVTDGENITGHRTRFIDNESKILVTIPDLGNPGLYDVTVRNPDMMEDTWVNGFDFNKGMDKKPFIEEVVPPQGSVDGGYSIIIKGDGFEDGVTSDNKTKVWINSLPAQVVGVKLSGNGDELEVVVPPYDGDLKKELESLNITIPRKSVPIAVANPTTSASYLLEKGFSYVIPNSKPVINSLSKNESNAAGGEYIQINGADFRYYEAFFTANVPDSSAVAGRDFIDINGDGVWTNLSRIRNIADLTAEDLKILPEIYFGTRPAEIVDFGENYVGVKIPAHQAGTVDVYLVNNDSGVSNKVKFTYRSSNPTITKLVPDTGNRAGNDRIDIHGQDFSPSKFNLINPQGRKSEQNMMLVKFGDIGNRDDLESGRIIGGEVPDLTLEGNLQVKYDAYESTLILTLKQGDNVYSRVFDNYDDSPVFINLQELADESGNRWHGHELIKVEVVRGNINRLIVERGYAPKVHFEDSGHLTVNTPSYYTVGKVPLIVINPDGGSATGQFEYKNPDSNPKIINILRDGREPVETNINGRDLKVVHVNYQSNSEVTILGEDFRDNAFIHIGEILTINPNDIYYELPTKLTITMPDIPEANVGKLYPVVIVNQDGGVAHSDNLPGEQKPIYIQFTKGETDPDIGDISPMHGPTIGGTVVKISGEDFRSRVDGYEGRQLTVYFGGIKADQVEVIDHKTVQAISPANEPGALSIRVENPDGSISTPSSEFNYISNPKVTAIINATDPTETTRIRSISVEGGEEIKLKGIGFMEGAKVYFMPEIKEAVAGASGGNLIYRVGTKSEEYAGELHTSNVITDYLLESGVEGLEVNYIDPETLTLKVPAGKLEGKGLIVVNPDQGASDIYDDITYGLPELEAPLGVRAEIMHDKYNNTDTGIKVTWTGVKGASEYELYVVEDDQMDFIGSTKLLAYIHEDLKARTSYKFIVKAVGDFGASKPSAESNTVRTGRNVGIPDVDGGIIENTKEEKKGNRAYVTLGTREGRSNLVIDLTRGDLAGAEELVLTMPASTVSTNRNMLIDIKGTNFAMKLSPAVFNNTQVSQSRNKEEAGVRLVVKPTLSNASSSANGLSPVFSVKADFYENNFTTPFDYLATNMSIVMDYDVMKAKMRNFRNVGVNRFDPYSSRWQPLAKDTYISGATAAVINRMGDYVVMGGRN